MSAEWFHATLGEGDPAEAESDLDALARNVGCVRVGPWEQVEPGHWRCLAERAEVSA